MAEMVWCQSCKTVVWAYDHCPSSHLSGIINEMALPCPLCGSKSNFDGIGFDDLQEGLREGVKVPIDDWTAMKYQAKFRKLQWNPSPDNHWFRD